MLAINALLAVAAGLFLTAGVLWFCRWRILRESGTELVGITLVVLGSISVLIGGLTIVIAEQSARVWVLGAVAFLTSVAGLTLRRAVQDLEAAIALDHARLDTVSDALELAQTAVVRQVSLRENVAHDAQGALAGLRAALFALEGECRGHAPDRNRSPLRRAAIDEVGHLEHLLARDLVEADCRFDVDDLVRHTVEIRRALGVDIEVRSSPNSIAYGRPHDLVTVLQNLLVNAEAHAPHSPVDVEVTAGTDQVTVTVSDTGPGVGARDAERVFDRGARGEASNGSGLGLHIARSLMREQHGDLELLRRDRGAAFVLSIPSPPAFEGPAGQRPVLPTPVRRDGRLSQR